MLGKSRDGDCFKSNSFYNCMEVNFNVNISYCVPLLVFSRARFTYNSDNVTVLVTRERILASVNIVQ